MEKSTHKAFVKAIKLEKHPDPETTALSLVKIGGWEVVVRTEDWIGVDKGVYIQPDTLVPDSGPFEFLFKKRFKISSPGEEDRILTARSEDEIFADELGVPKDQRENYEIKSMGGNSRFSLLKDETCVKNEEGDYVRITVRKFKLVIRRHAQFQ